MVVGARTIKCYGWEEHYIKRIQELRRRQENKGIKLMITTSLGISFFPNFGLIAVAIILGMEWAQGNKL
jgi:hypothetical protein